MSLIVRKNKRQMSMPKWMVLTSLLVVSCTQSVLDEVEKTDYAICFQIPRTESRGIVEGNSLPANSSFLVWGGYDGSVQNVFNGENVAEVNGIWDYVGNTRYWLPGKMYDFYGVYPAELPEGTNVSVAAENNGIAITSFDCSATGENAIDLMTAFATGDGDNPAKVNMNFSHELARVSIVIRSRFADAVLSQASLYGMAVKGQLSVTEASSSWEVESLVTNVSTPYKLNGPSTIEVGKELNLWENLLVIPQALNDLKLKVQYTDAGGTLQEPEISLVTSTLQEWVAGKSYRYTLTIEPDGILFENLTADAWGETSSGGSIIIH